MDTNYWTTGLSTPAATRAAGVVDTSKLGFAMSGVVDLAQSVGIPYGTVDVNSAASLEFLLGQQRFAATSGLSFLPYTSAGTAYATQVHDSSQNVGVANCLSYNTVSKQSSVPGVFYEVPISVAIQPSSVSGSLAAYQYKCLTTAASTVDGDSSLRPFNLSSQVYASIANNHMNAVATPVSAHTGNISQSVSKQTLQQFNFSDLLDYGSAGVPDQASSSQSREQPSRSFSDTVLRHHQQSTQVHASNVRHQMAQSSSANSMAQRHVDRVVNQLSMATYGHERVMGVATPVPNETRNLSNKVPPLEQRSQAMQMPLTVHSGSQHQKNQTISSLLSSSAVTRPETIFRPMSMQSLEMRSQPVLLSQSNMDKTQSVTFWPYDGLSLTLGDDHRVIVENSLSTSAVNCGDPTESHDPAGEHVIYEAVSPAGAVGVNDHMGYNFLDSLQLNNLFGSTVDASILYTPQTLHSSTVDSSKLSVNGQQDDRMRCGMSNNKSTPVRDVLAEAVSQAFNLDKPVMDESDKCLKQKPNLGIVLPLSHGGEHIRSAPIAPVTGRISNSSKADMPTVSQSFESNSMYAQSDQASFDKLSMPMADGHSSAAGGGGIVLTNITGNVYVNQYTMLPGGTQAVDNALLHTDLAMFPSVGCLSSYADDALLLENEACNEQPSSSSSAPMMSVVLQANEADDELGHLAVDPVMDVCEKTVSRPKNSARVNQPRKSTDFYGANPSPVIAAKPSNEFESCFLKFLCGHKAETLSSVLNSPIKVRPELPKYIPEIRRPRNSINSESSVTSADVEIIDSSSSERIEKDKVEGIVNEPIVVQEASNSEPIVLPPVQVESYSIPEVADRPDGPKLPAKFSHKWKNRTTISVDPPSVQASSLNQSSAKESDKNATDSKMLSLESTTVSPSNGKMKNHANQQWTVAKKPKLSKDSSLGLKLVLKVVAPSSSRSTSAGGSKRS